MSRAPLLAITALTVLSLVACGKPGDDSDLSAGDESDSSEGDDPDLPDEDTGDPDAWCPDVETPLQHFPDGRFLQLGPCGDLLMNTDPGYTLVPVEGAPELPLPSGFIRYELSPRGRVLLAHDSELAMLTVRELGQAGEQQFTLTEDAQSGFVVSELAPGSRVWICDDDTLDLIVDGARTNLATDVNCETVAPSPMHAQLVVATLEQEVLWIDTEAGTVTPTSLVGFEYDVNGGIGTRKDALEMSPSGAYMIHTTQELIDNDGAPIPYPIDESLFDLDHDATLSSHELSFAYYQAPVVGAPLFVRLGNELLGVRDGQLLSITTATEPFTFPVAARDGSIVVIESDGAVVRYSGEQFEIREVEVSAEPGNWTLTLSPDGQSGAVSGPTQLCATPSCASQLGSLWPFSSAGPGPQLLSASSWRIVHVFDDGSVLAGGSLVDGPFAEEVALPDPKLLLIGVDGQVRADWDHDPELRPTNGVWLADGRAVVGLSGWDLASELLAVDADTATITKVAEYAPFLNGVEWIEVDALGERIAVVVSYTAGVAWGQVP